MAPTDVEKKQEQINEASAKAEEKIAKAREEAEKERQEAQDELTQARADNLRDSFDKDGNRKTEDDEEPAASQSKASSKK